MQSSLLFVSGEHASSYSKIGCLFLPLQIFLCESWNDGLATSQSFNFSQKLPRWQHEPVNGPLSALCSGTVNVPVSTVLKIKIKKILKKNVLPRLLKFLYIHIVFSCTFWITSFMRNTWPPRKFSSICFGNGTVLFEVKKHIRYNS